MNSILYISSRTADNSIISLNGLPSSSDYASLSVPKSLFSDFEADEFKKDNLLFSKYDWNEISDTLYINFKYDWNNLVFSQISFSSHKKEVNFSDIVTESFPDFPTVSALVAYNNKTNTILFAEGTDIDGYTKHTITAESLLLVSPDLDKQYMNDALIEAKDFCGDYNNHITIDIFRFPV